MDVPKSIRKSGSAKKQAGLGLIFIALAVAHSASAQDLPAIDVAEEILRDTYGDLGDDLAIKILPTQHKLEYCKNPEPFLKSRRINSSGRLFVGLNCSGTRYGSIYLPAEITVQGDYVVTRESVQAGSIIDESMLELRHGNITALLDRGVFDMSEAVGRVAGRSLARGVVLRQQHLKELQLVERGEPVSFELIGSGFRIAGKGEALESGNPGDLVRVRTQQRKTITGVVTQRGVVHVQP
jgi:flagella basal body P-ring formation protein FlgA